eukprot:TRINITY_DN312_c0_g1_i13.p1 TRINITY_DN312_c0_g1~~TRINITY_DN312_c0_g1_i13.p1  ORF type:complete len:809 (+),score=167.93 TRINITY_DN312_c0_g1_i13:129-2429(+)
MDVLKLRTLDADTIRAGQVVAQSFMTYSDARLKEDIRSLEPDVQDRLSRIGAYVYKYKAELSSATDDEQQRHEHIGLLAQEVLQEFPQAVLRHPDCYLAVDYSQLVPVLIQAQQEQRAESRFHSQQLHDFKCITEKRLHSTEKRLRHVEDTLPNKRAAQECLSVTSSCHGVPPNGKQWLPRDHEVTALLNAIQSSKSGLIGVTAVSGMGGIGKTTLCTMLCNHPATLEAFPDGIYWLTLGDDCKDALPLQKQLASYGGWTDERLKQLQTAAGAVEPLRMAFKGLRCLLILDDVWDDRLARYLMVVDLDAGAKVFISSRNGDVLDRMDAWRYSVDFLSPTDCTHVMLKYSKWSLTTVTELDDKLQLFWKRCGRLALAVAMIGCILSEMTPSVNSLSYIDAQMQSSAGITGTVVDNDKYENVYAVIELSLRMLNDRVQIERLAKSRFRDLAVLAEDAVISVTPTPTIHVNTPLSCVDLWTNHKRADAMDEQTARLVVQKLVQRCLLIQVGEDKYKLHDIVWAYLNATVTSDQERDDICLRLAESVQEPWILEYVLRLVMLPLCWATSDFGVDTFRFRQRWVQRTECLQWILKDSSLRTDGNHSLCYVEDDDVLQEMIQLRPSIIQEAVQWHGVDYGRTVLHWCQSSSVVKLLCDAGANANALDNDGETPLYCALRYHIEDDYSIAQQLVECGADVNNVSREHRSGITACYLNPYHGGRHPVVKWLIRLPVIDRRLALSELRTLNLPPERRDLLHDAGWNLSTVAEHHE